MFNFFPRSRDADADTPLALFFPAPRRGGNYFLRNLLKMLPDLGGVGVGLAPREGRGSGDLTAFAGTARGERVLALVGLGRMGLGVVLGIPAGTTP